MTFSSATVQAVWEKGTVVSNYDPDKYRKESCEAWIQRDSYGDHDSSLGWDIDHIKPQSEGGGDELSNLQPLQWENNISKGDGPLKCVVTSKGNRNVPVT